MKKFHLSALGLLAVLAFAFVFIAFFQFFLFVPIYLFMIISYVLKLNTILSVPPLTWDQVYLFSRIFNIVFSVVFFAAVFTTLYVISAKLERFAKKRGIVPLVLAWLLVTGVTVDLASSAYRWTRPVEADRKECSWFKQLPQDWTCKDNWNYTYRVVEASSDKQTFTLEMTKDKLKPLPAFCIPIAFPANPSISGLTVPLLCLGKQGIFFESIWDQDNWNFRLTGRNIGRRLFLDNLYRIGG